MNHNPAFGKASEDFMEQQVYFIEVYGTIEKIKGSKAMIKRIKGLEKGTDFTIYFVQAISEHWRK